MTALTNLASDFETALAGALKRCFDENGVFEVHFDHSTVNDLNEALHGIGLSVFAMNYTESDICITLQLSKDMTEACGNNMFHYCQFSVNNDGDFSAQISDETLNDGLHLRLTTPYGPSIFSKATSAEIDTAVHVLRIAFQTRLLTLQS